MTLSTSAIPAMAERIEVWPVERLIPYAGNARTHSDEQIAKVAASMVEFGFTNPILVDGRDGIVAGHCRLAAANRIGLENVPVVVLDHLTDAQRRAYILADNRLALDGGWDEEVLTAELARLQEDEFNLDLIGFSDEEMTTLLEMGDGLDDGGAGTGEEEAIPEPPATPVTQPGDLWVLGEHRLLCGSSINPDDVIRLMNRERASLFSTDPPYLVDYDGHNRPSQGKKTIGRDWSDTYGVTWDDSSQGPEFYEGFIKAAVDHAITSDAAWYCWHASKRQAMLEAVWEKFGAFVHQSIYWVKPRGLITRSWYLWRSEPCFMGWIKGNKPHRLEGKEMLSNVWEIDGLEGDDRPDHPTPKPLDCFANPMRQHIKAGGLCYEPFSGSGSQIMAGEMTNRRVNAMEISPVYVDVAVKRFIQATGKIVYLDGSGGKTFEDIAKERGVALSEDQDRQ